VENMSILENDVVLGTFSNTTKYIELLEQSVKKFLPNIHAIQYIGDGPVNVNMTHLREEFINTGKRYWIYCDHDIQVLNQTIIQDALTALVSNKVGLVTVYSSHDPKYLTLPYDNSKCIEGIIPWSVGYFLMIDSTKVGYVVPDMGLPNPNYGIDVAFSVEVRKAGYDIFISKNYVYHLKKGNPQHDEETTKITDEYLFNKYGQFYRDCYQPINVNLP
jgi:hypothetical protein